MNPIDALFAELKKAGRKAFMPFITAGDPDLAATVETICALADAGADLVEIGFPYSDPIADGPVIQASYTRALEKGLKVQDIFLATAQARARLDNKGKALPFVAMVSASILHRFGQAAFYLQAKNSGFSGLIVPDLPAEESANIASALKIQGLHLVQLVTPNTPRERARQIVQASSGFVYCVSVSGITGERDMIPAQLISQLQWLREETRLPLCVGFGVSKPAHAALLRQHVDGVIVGSALVRLLAPDGQRTLIQSLQEIKLLSRGIRSALDLPS
ncbi:MAG: tryptophan synthase subunit alpha [Gemmataceae bacterium]|nr:tryptophan synthase subunit alpha [Gemmataceae bacterium]